MLDLDAIAVASPCTADWNAMTGDERVRHCGLCNNKVYALSVLTRAEAEALVAKAEGGARVCVRFFRRTDGTVLTQDCPIGLAARLRRRVLQGFAAVAAAVVMLLGLIGWRYAREPEPIMGRMVMGDICPPPTAPVAPSGDGGRRLPSAD